MNKDGTFSIREALEFGWQTTIQNIGFFIVVLLVMFGVQLVLNGVSATIPQDATLLVSIVAIIGWIVSAIFTMGLVKITLALADGKKPQVRDLWSVIRPVGTFIGASIIVGIVSGVGLLLLIIPGLLLAASLQFFQYRVVDAGDTVFDSISNSWKLTRGSRWKLVGLMIVVVLANMAGALLFGIGLIITLPLTALATAHVYRSLSYQQALNSYSENQAQGAELDSDQDAVA